jgi:hypothetical protein
MLLMTFFSALRILSTFALLVQLAIVVQYVRPSVGNALLTYSLEAPRPSEQYIDLELDLVVSRSIVLMKKSS